MQNNWMQRADKVVMNTYGRQPLVLVKGQGSRVWDDTGKEYLDCVAGLAVCNLGHAHPAIAKAAAAQLTQLVHVSNIYYTTPMVELAEALVQLSFADRVFFANSGAEVNEGAIKLVRRFSQERNGPGRHRIICMENSFHGRTLGALSATGQSKFWQGFDPLLPGFSFVPFNDLEAVAQAVDDTVCAVMLEPVQGEGGVNLPSPDYFTGLRQLCDEKGLLLILDEIQTGLGRTGTALCPRKFRHHPGCHDPGQGIGQRPAHGRAPGHRSGGRGLRPRGPRQHLRGRAGGGRGGQNRPGPVERPGVSGRSAGPGGLAPGKAGRFPAPFPGHYPGAGPGPHVGPGIGRRGGAAGGGLPGAGALLNCTQGNVIRLLPPLVITPQELDAALAILGDAFKAVFP